MMAARGFCSSLRRSHLTFPLAVTALSGAYRSLGTEVRSASSSNDAPPQQSTNHNNGRADKDAGKFALSFLAELTYLPSPDKLAKGSKGEDAYLVSKHTIGVADGVGGWSDVGVDSGVYSRMLMDYTLKWAEKQAEEAEENRTALEVDPLAALSHGFHWTRERGSSTACVATIGSEGRLRVLNVGDSGLMIWRHDRLITLHPTPKLSLGEAEKLWTPLLRSTEQQHYFNCPYQLENGGDDTPEKGQRLEYFPRPGDLVLLGTDGLFDNLFEHDIRAALSKVDFTPCHDFVRAKRRRYLDAKANGVAAAGDPAVGSALALDRVVGGKEDVYSDAQMRHLEKGCRAVLLSVSAALAVGSQRVGLDPVAKSPFSAGAKAAGMRYQGGKLDDVVALVALVVPDASLVRSAETGAGGTAVAG